jgi:hypothetical protein
MAVKAGVGVDALHVPNATGTLFTPGTGVTRAVITSAVFYANIAGSTLALFIVPSGGSPTIANQVTSKALALDETFTAPELIGQSIETGGTLQGNDGGVGGTDISVVLTVTEFTGDS